MDDVIIEAGVPLRLFSMAIAALFVRSGDYIFLSTSSNAATVNICKLLKHYFNYYGGWIMGDKLKKRLLDKGIRIEMLLFLILIAVVALGNNMGDSVFSNYFKEVYNVTASQRAFINFRENFGPAMCTCHRQPVISWRYKDGCSYTDSGLCRPDSIGTLHTFLWNYAYFPIHQFPWNALVYATIRFYRYESCRTRQSRASHGTIRQYKNSCGLCSRNCGLFGSSGLDFFLCFRN